jgi:hypothetical protein
MSITLAWEPQTVARGGPKIGLLARLLAARERSADLYVARHLDGRSDDELLRLGLSVERIGRLRSLARGLRATG